MTTMRIKHISTVKRLANLILGMFLVLNFGACKKWIEVDPPSNSITSQTVFEDVNTATSVLNSVYFKMQNQLIFGLRLGLVADELAPRIPDPFLGQYFTNDYQMESGIPETWNDSYGTFIYNLNLVIEGVSSSKGLSQNNKRIIIAEAKFTRAFLYFYLVNLYGDIPLVLTTDFKVNSSISRTSVETVYQQIVDDLSEAKANLPNSYLGTDLLTPTNDRVRPTKWAALALLARVYLFQEDWINAEQSSTEVINNTGTFHLEALEDVFKKTSAEAIWSLQPEFLESSDAANNTVDAKFYIPYPNSLPDFFPNNELLNQFSNVDRRKIKWFGVSIDNTVMPAVSYYYPYKYKFGNNYTSFFQDQQEHLVVLRLAEQYLIRAEARAQLDRITGSESAAEDLNIIRIRAGLKGSTAINKSDMLKAILDERRLELFTEWGHRWLDLKRTKKVDDIMEVETPKKGGQWAPYKALFPIPFSEFVNNPTLRGQQNPGYRETQ